MAGRPYGLANVIGTDPGTGTAHAIPNGARSFVVHTVGTGFCIVRVAPNATVTGIGTAGAVVPPGVDKEFDLSPESDTHVQIAEHTGAAITAYYISFTR